MNQKKPKKNPLSFNSVALCTECPALGKHHVPAYGNPRSPLMVIGQSPGRTEVKEREPFVGRSGQLLEFMLLECGLAKEDVYITNVLKCHPSNNRKAYPAEMENCKKNWLDIEIRAVKPKLILLLGRDAHTAVIGDDTPFEHLQKIVRDGVVHLTSYHPAWFIRKGKGWDKFVQDVGGRVTELLKETHYD